MSPLQKIAQWTALGWVVGALVGAAYGWSWIGIFLIGLANAFVWALAIIVTLAQEARRRRALRPPRIPERHNFRVVEARPVVETPWMHDERQGLLG